MPGNDHGAIAPQAGKGASSGDGKDAPTIKAVAMSTDDALKKAEALKLQMEQMKAAMAAKMSKSKKRKAKSAAQGQSRAKKAAVGEKPSLAASNDIALRKSSPAPQETKVAPIQQGKAVDSKVNPYLAHLRQDMTDEEDRAIQEERERKEARRASRTFKIIPKGTYIKSAEIQREREARQAFYRDRRDKDARRHFKQLLAKKAGVLDSEATSERKPDVPPTKSSSSSAQKKSPGLPVRATEKITPSSVRMEWWDKPFLISNAKGTSTKKRKLDSGQGAQDCFASDYRSLALENVKTYKLVEHPAYVTPLVMAAPAREMPLYMTKDERKRLRRQNRRAREQLQQDKIAAGLIPPPPPKVKLGNMMRVLGDLFVADPSKLEAYVKEQTAERVRSHLMRGAAAKLTPLEKYQKRQAKIAADAVSGSINTTVYRISDLCHPPELAANNRFKIDVHAQKLGITGCAIILKDPVQVEDGSQIVVSAIVAEGGPKALRKFDREMRRVNFPPFSGKEQGSHGCARLWQGVIPQRKFPQKLEFHDLELRGLKPFLQRHSLDKYWDMVVDKQFTHQPIS